MKNTVPVSQNTNQKKEHWISEKEKPESGDFLSEPAEITHTSDSPEKTAQNLETVISVEPNRGFRQQNRIRTVMKWQNRSPVSWNYLRKASCSGIPGTYPAL